MEPQTGSPKSETATKAALPTSDDIRQVNGHRRLQLAVSGAGVAVLQSGDWKPIHAGTWGKPVQNVELAKQLTGFALDVEKAAGTPFKTWRAGTGALLCSLQTKNGVVHVHLTLPEDGGSRTVRAGSVSLAAAEKLLEQA